MTLKQSLPPASVYPPNWNYPQNSTFWAVLGSRGSNIISEVSLVSFSTELVDKKIEEFLVCFEEKLKILTTEAFSAQVTREAVEMHRVRMALLLS